MQPIVVTVTGAAGNIGYAILPRIASGAVFGPNQPVILKLLEIPAALKAVEGVKMELLDCAPPLLYDVVTTSDLDTAFGDCRAAFLVGARPRGPGMERADLLKANGPIFTGQGQSLANVAHEDVRVLVVGNPANTNCLIAARAAQGKLSPDHFSAMTRLDQNRASAMLAARAGVKVRCVANVAIWGNHSPTMVPDVEHATIGMRPAREVINDDAWLQGDYTKSVAQRGKAIIDARGQSSAFSAAHAAIEHMRLWMLGTPPGEWTSMAVMSDGSYGVPEGIVCSFPVTCRGDGSYHIVQGLTQSPWVKQKLETSWKELQSERDDIKDLLK